MKYITKLSSVYYFIEYSILFFNSINIIGGTILFSYYIKNINPTNNNTIIENCDNIFLLDFLGIINSFLVFSIISDICEIRLLSFASNIALSGYNYYHIHKITQTCITYYSNTTDNINYISIYYLYNIFVQSITNLMFIIICCLCVRVSNENKRKEIEEINETTNLVTSNNIYPQIDDYDTGNLYDSME